MLNPSKSDNNLIRPREFTRQTNATAESLAEAPVQNILTTSFLSTFYNVRRGLAEDGLQLSTNETLALILIKEFVAAARKITITKREAYNAVIRLYLDISYMTFNRLFNSLVRKHCFNPLGARGNGKLGLSEEYALTTVSKKVDAILKVSIGEIE